MRQVARHPQNRSGEKKIQNSLVLPNMLCLYEHMSSYNRVTLVGRKPPLSMSPSGGGPRRMRPSISRKAGASSSRGACKWRPGRTNSQARSGRSSGSWRIPSSFWDPATSRDRRMTTTTGTAAEAKGGERTGLKSAGNRRGPKTVVPIRNVIGATRPLRAEGRSGVPAQCGALLLR